MTLYMALLPAFLLIFGASWLYNIFVDFMWEAADSGPDIQPVEVVNVGDFPRGR